MDAVFVEALPDREAMKRCSEEIGIPVFANIIEGGKTENLSALELAQLGFCAVAYPWTLVAAKLKSIRETLDDLKKSMTIGAPPMILGYSEVCEGVGFNRYWVCYILSNLSFRKTYHMLTMARLVKQDMSMMRTGWSIILKTELGRARKVPYIMTVRRERLFRRSCISFPVIYGCCWSSR